ncbi:hypothetical protein M427DRAFT_134921 [Gonapodya prolifera JEL478]|uniref:Uncharacterized protein n=1 Tax=Gonapodya prolifera (strain JEL478) TaxID=1344416 RepID=A0A139AFX6_GONPJ|nr:hypothetical protein M427DRAFT_134921 [Gonapodya prolifera JEL478]|eukprot:KXS15658.1 hypothetical protein M427DRAFT_134921 [Gonapodya prolifera JEL478]
MTGNKAWAWRANDLDHGTAMKECDEGYPRITCAFALGKYVAKHKLRKAQGSGVGKMDFEWKHGEEAFYREEAVVYEMLPTVEVF